MFLSQFLFPENIFLYSRKNSDKTLSRLAHIARKQKWKKHFEAT
jgi:hypothetical protein